MSEDSPKFYPAKVSRYTVLKQQFPNVNGLESTLNQIKERKLTEKTKYKLYIVYTRNIGLLQPL